MKTEVIRVDPREPAEDAIRYAADVLLRGGLVAFPTETVYGLGALADDRSAIAAVYAAKGRPSYNPLIVHVPGADEARAIAQRWPPAAQALAQAFWPGPLTLVVPRGSTIPETLSAGLPTMAVRAPRHAVAQALLRAVGRPVAAPSANPSTQLSPTRAEHVIKGLSGRVDLILDAGACPLGIESTVVDVTREPALVLRPGSITLAELAMVTPEVATQDTRAASGVPRASPGLEAKHYAPRARLVLAPREALAEAARRAAPPLGVLARGTTTGLEVAREIVLPEDARGYASGLFAALHALDDTGCRTVLVERVPEDPQWDGVRDRLARASAA